LRRVNDFSFFIFVDFYEVNLFQDETQDVFVIQLKTNTLPSITFEKAYKIIE